MKLAKVIGTIVSTAKDPSLKGLKILVIQPVNDLKKSVGSPLAAIDMAQSGPGDLVWWIMGREASMGLPNTFAPVDATITGIVDHVYVNDVGVLDRDKIFARKGSR